MDPVAIMFLSLCYYFMLFMSIPPLEYFIDEELGFLWNSFNTVFRAFLCMSIFCLPAPLPRLYILLFLDFDGNADDQPRDVNDDSAHDSPRFLSHDDCQ